MDKESFNETRKMWYRKFNRYGEYSREKDCKLEFMYSIDPCG
jgi:hypothetical protein